MDHLSKVKTSFPCRTRILSNSGFCGHPLVTIDIAIEHGPLIDVLPMTCSFWVILPVIFNSFFSLPDCNMYPRSKTMNMVHILVGGFNPSEKY